MGARLSAIKKYNESEAARPDVNIAPKALKVKLEDEAPHSKHTASNDERSSSSHFGRVH